MIVGQLARGYRRTAFLKDGSSGSENNGQAASDLAKKALDSAKQSTEGTKKESFDDFYESLMKGKGQSGRATSSAGAAGAVNLDGILSSLNKSPSDFKKEEADSRFAQIFQRKAAEQKESTSSVPASEPDLEQAADALADGLLEDDKEFTEFMKALRVDYEHKKANGILPKSTAPFKFPKATPGFSAKVPSSLADLSKLNAEQAKKDFSEAVYKFNPELAAAASRGPTPVSRSQVELMMAKKDAHDQVDLDEALREIDRTGMLPDYVIGARIPNLATGESNYVDLLQSYADPALGDVAELASEEAEAKNGALADDQDMDDEGDYELTAGDEMFLKDPMTANLFEALKDESKSIEEMQYWSLFPKAIKRWLVYTRAPKGYYNDFGEWVVAPQKDPETILAEELEHLNKDIDKEIEEESVGFGGLAETEEGEEALEGAEEGEEGLDMDDPEFAELANARNFDKRSDIQLDKDFDMENLTAEQEELLGEGDEMEFVNESGHSLTDDMDLAEEDLETALQDEAFEDAEAEMLGEMEAPFTADDNADLKKALNSDWDFWQAQYDKEQRYLPVDLQGKYRFHVQPEEIEGMHPRLRRHFSFKFASEGEITKYRAAEHVRKWGRHPGDTGNSAVQIAILTLRINHLTKTLRSNTSDTQNAYRLTGLVRRRKALMKHLKKADLRTYYSLLKDIDLRDQVELWTAARK